MIFSLTAKKARDMTEIDPEGKKQREREDIDRKRR